MGDPDRSTIVFALDPSGALGRRIALELGLESAPVDTRWFDDGEQRTRPDREVDGRPVIVVQSLHGDGRRTVHDRLCQLLLFVRCLRDLGATEVRLVAPYLCYARQDRRIGGLDPVSNRYVAELLETAGATEVTTLEVHARAAFENGFRVPTRHVDAAPLVADRLLATAPDAPWATVSPDAGGVKRVERLRHVMEERSGRSVPDAFLIKERVDHVVPDGSVIGEIAGRWIVVFDDLLASGSTARRAADACRRQGAEHVVVAAAHGLFIGDAVTQLQTPSIDEVIVTDSIATDPTRRALGSLVTEVSAAPSLAAALSGHGVWETGYRQSEVGDRAHRTR